MTVTLRRTAARLRSTEQHDEACASWPSAEVRTEVLEEQVAQLLDGAKPNRESAPRIRAALKSPPRAVDHARIWQIGRRLRQLGIDLVSSPKREREAILLEVDGLQAERASVADAGIEAPQVQAEEALDYLNDLGRLWRDTQATGQTRLGQQRLLEAWRRPEPAAP